MILIININTFNIILILSILIYNFFEHFINIINNIINSIKNIPALPVTEGLSHWSGEVSNTAGLATNEAPVLAGGRIEPFCPAGG